MDLEFQESCLEQWVLGFYEEGYPVQWILEF